MTNPALLALADEAFVSLTTFRKSGVGVATTVWIARDGDELLVTTTSVTGKAKRLRNDPRVTLTPSTRSGKVPEGAPVVEATATIAAPTARDTAAFLAKYKLQYRIFMWIGRRRRSIETERVTLHIR